MTPERIKEIRERLEKITPGKWEVYSGQIVCGVEPMLGQVEFSDVTKEISRRYGDAMFIAHAPAAIRELLDEVERIHKVVSDVHSQRGDDVCWMDIDKIFQACGLPVPDRSVGDKCAMLENCKRFITTMCIEGAWKSYAELERENAELRKALDSIEAEAVGEIANETLAGNIVKQTYWEGKRNACTEARAALGKEKE